MKSFGWVLPFILVNLSIYSEVVTDKEIFFTRHRKEEIISTLREIVPPNPFVIPADKVKEITINHNLEVEELMRLLVPVARFYARPPISNYKVGVATLGKSGNIYLGVNLEFLGVPLNEAIHGEQFAVTNARSHGETELVAIALSAAPCGHCRQFLNEMEGSEDLRVLILDSGAILLSSLLPDAFGPKDLGLTANLLTASKCESPFLDENSLLGFKALQAALASYAPYTESKSGVAIQLKDGTIYSGSYLENAAFNPSLSPLQAALILLVANLREYDEISEVVLIEKKSAQISQEAMTRGILKNIAPEAICHVKKLEF